LYINHPGHLDYDHLFVAGYSQSLVAFGIINQDFGKKINITSAIDSQAEGSDGLRAGLYFLINTSRLLAYVGKDNQTSRLRSTLAESVCTCPDLAFSASQHSCLKGSHDFRD
jgi:hypothetical protein